MDRERFLKICLRYRENIRERSGIGTLGEKTVHAVLKDYFEPNSEYQEIKVDGYFADIARKGEIFEIQTRDLCLAVLEIHRPNVRFSVFQQ